MGIEVKNINKKYQETNILQDVNLIVETGELMALLGPSGSGKTSLLRIIAGLETADSGHVLLEGEEAETQKIQNRNVGFVFQHYALFKHMTVFDNAAFGLKVKPRKKRPSSSQIRSKISNLLELMHLEGYEKHYPSQLSGGQQQRVALVRALALDPKVLLLDEPFGALDAKVRKELCRWIRMLHDKIKVSSIFVTHDQEEALEVSDRVCIMNQGKILQVDTPERISRYPANHFVFTFLGDHNEFDGWTDSKGRNYLIKPEVLDVHTTKLYARPYEIQISCVGDEKANLKARISHINTTGSLIKIELDSRDKKIIFAQVTHEEFIHLKVKVNDLVFVIPKKLYQFE